MSEGAVAGERPVVGEGAGGVGGSGGSCFECLYDLRGQPLDGACPECGAGVAGSMRGDRWDRADGRWRRVVRWGVGLSVMEYGWLGAFMAASAGLGLEGEVAAILVYGGMGFFAALGGWMVAAPEPGGAGGGTVGLRGLAVAGGLAYWSVVVTGVWVEWVTVGAWALVQVAAVVLLALSGIRQVMLLRHVGRLLARVPGRPLRRAARGFPCVPLAAWWAMGAAMMASESLGEYAMLGVLAPLAGLAATMVYWAVAWRALRVPPQLNAGAA